jgi:hypothetical protein
MSVSMPMIGHLIQVDAASSATVFANEMPVRMQCRTRKMARLSRHA